MSKSILNKSGESKWKLVIHSRYFYIMMIPVVLYYILFVYMPMYGIVLAFKKFQFNLPIIHAPWVGLDNFHTLFALKDFSRVFWNSVQIAFGRLLFEFPVPIIIALLLNEIRLKKAYRLYQTIFTFPHFLSWVIVVGVLNGIFSSEGVLNQIVVFFGGEQVNYLVNSSLFRPLLYMTSIWKEAGWGAIIYIAALAGINPEQYESADIDGANRFHKMIFITWPGIVGTVSVLLLLKVGNFINNYGDFDQIVNMYNSAVIKVSDIIDTSIYRTTFVQGGADWGVNTALGLFKSVIGLMLLFITDRVIKLIGEDGIF